MIISTLLFNDEFDMLDIYLEITSLYCDRWIIAEGDRTFSGRPKEYNLSNNMDRYAQYRDRIDVMQLKIPEGYRDWQCDNWSRIAIQEQINQYDDEDIFIHGDTDEICNPQRVPEILELMDRENKPVAVGMDMYIYRFDQAVNRGWNGPVWARKRMFQNPQQLIKGNQTKRKDRSHCVALPGSAGWHWTWMGDDDRIRSKIVSCIESQNRDVEQVLDAFKRQDTAAAINHKCATHYKEDTGYPPEVMAVISKYPYWTK